MCCFYAFKACLCTLGFTLRNCSYIDYVPVCCNKCLNNSDVFIRINEFDALVWLCCNSDEFAEANGSDLLVE